MWRGARRGWFDVAFYHLDHTAGAVRLQELSGARIAMGDADWDALTRAPNPTNERLLGDRRAHLLAWRFPGDRNP